MGKQKKKKKKKKKFPQQQVKARGGSKNRTM